MLLAFLSLSAASELLLMSVWLVSKQYYTGFIFIVVDPNISPSDERTFGVAGTTVHLNCSISPGVAVEQYYVQWQSASNPNRVFYRSFSPQSNVDPVNMDRYSVDSSTLGLLIQDATLADGDDQYVCILGVEDPIQPSRPFVYMQTENVNLSLSIISK